MNAIRAPECQCLSLSPVKMIISTFTIQIASAVKYRGDGEYRNVFRLCVKFLLVQQI